MFVWTFSGVVDAIVLGIIILCIIAYGCIMLFAHILNWFYGSQH